MIDARGPATLASRLRALAPTWVWDAMLSASAIGIVGLSATAFAILYGRRFGDDGLGHAALALAVGTGVPQVACAGLVGGLTRFVAARREHDHAGTRRALARGLGAFAALALVLAFGVLATAPAWSARIGLPSALVAPAAALAGLECLYFGIKAALYGLGRVGGYAVLEGVGGAVFVALLIMVLGGLSLPAIAPFIGADVVMVALGLGALWRWRARGQPDDPTSQRLGRAVGASGAGPDVAALPSPAPGSMTRWVATAYLGTAASLARLRLPILVTGAVHAADAVGQLQAAFALFAPLMLAPRALELALLPSLATAYGRSDRAALRNRTAAATAVVAAAMAVLGGSLLLGAELVLVVLFGPSFAPAAPALVAVVVGAWLVGLASPSVVALAGADGIGVVSGAGVAGLAGSALAWLVAVPAFGPAGAAAGFAVGSVVAAGVPIVVARRRYGVALEASAAISRRAIGLLALGGLLLALVQPDGGTGRIVVQAAVAAGYAVAAALAARGPLAAIAAAARAGRRG